MPERRGSQLSYVRIYATPDGESHFEDVVVDLSPAMQASLLSETFAATGMNLRRNEVEYSLDFHPAPRRQFIINLTGTVEMQVSDGEVRRFGPASILLVEDTSGKGHTSRSAGSDERISVFVHLPEA
jgi:hypothetical protein